MDHKEPIFKKYSQLTAVQRELCKPMSGVITPATTVVVNPDGSLLILYVKVTPRVADKWIGLKHEKQRKISAKNTDKLIRDMRSGKFLYTHDVIAFSTDGRQVNGNHRLHAVVKSGVTCFFNVLLGVPADTVMVMDAGSKRSIGQQLIMGGVDAEGLTTPISMVLRFESKSVADSPVTTPQVLAGLESYKKEIALVSGLREHHRGAFNGPPWGAILYVAKTHPEEAYDFARGVCTREGLKAGDPALAFLNWRDKEARSGTGYSNGTRGTRKHSLAAARCLRAQVLKKRLPIVDGESTPVDGKKKKKKRGPVAKLEVVRFYEEDVMKWMYSLRQAKRDAA